MHGRGVGMHRLQKVAPRSDGRRADTNPPARRRTEGGARNGDSGARNWHWARARCRAPHHQGNEGPYGSGVTATRKLVVNLRAKAPVWRIPEHVEQEFVANAPSGWTVSVVKA